MGNLRRAMCVIGIDRLAGLLSDHRNYCAANAAVEITVSSTTRCDSELSSWSANQQLII